AEWRGNNAGRGLWFPARVCVATSASLPCGIWNLAMTVDQPITGKTLIAWGYTSGAWFPAAIAAAEQARRSGADEAGIRAIVAGHAPPATTPLRPAGPAHYMNIRVEHPD